MATVIGFGRKGQTRGYRNAYRSYQQVMVIAVTHGELLSDSGGVRVPVNPGQAIVLPHRSAFTLSTPRRAYRGHYVEYDPADLALEPRVGVLAADPALRRAVDEIEAEYRHEGPDSLLAELYAVLGTRCLRRVRAKQVEGDDLCARIDALLAAHLHTADPLEAILSDLPCSHRHAARVYRARRGTTIKAAQLARKCRAATDLLTTTDQSITAIAMELGFPSSQHFATVFKRTTGKTPSAVRG